MNEIAPVEYTPHQKEIMLETVAKGCKPEQFMLMMELAKKYKLDPFAHQIWVINRGIIIGRDGFLTLAHNSGNFDGMETTFDEKDGILFSATCTVYHKKMNHPIRVTVRLSEFYKPTPAGKQPGAWERMPYVMLQKVAESHSLRRAFSVSGLYDEAELEYPSEEPECPPVVDADYTVNDPKPEPVPEKTEVNTYTKEQANQIRSIYESHGWNSKVIDGAHLDNDLYDRDMIDGDFKMRNRALDAVSGGA